MVKKTMKVPFPVDEDMALRVDSMMGYGENGVDDILNRAQTEEVWLEDLIASQSEVDTEYVEKLLKNKSYEEPNKVFIYRFPGGELLIQDGHHHATAAKMAKIKTIKALVSDLYEDELLYEFIRTQINEIIREPVRVGQTTRELGIEPGAGYENIMRVLRSATPEEVDFWSKWYKHAKWDVMELSIKYQLPFPIVAAVVAVLSPGNKWRMNIRAADFILAGVKKRGINAYPRDIFKAQKILETGDTSYVTGPKVTVFYRSLLDPKSVEHDIVLDGHAINLWRGKKVGLKGIRQPSIAERRQMIEDYKKAARDFGISVQGVQAVTWWVWKYTTDPDPGISLKFNLLPKS